MEEGEMSRNGSRFSREHNPELSDVELEQMEAQKRGKTSQASSRCLCFDLDVFPLSFQFLLLSLGVFLFFMLCSYFEEYLFQALPGFQFGWYLTFFELLCFAFFAALEATVTRVPLLKHNAPLKRHVIVAVAMTASRGLTNVSLQYLNYPTQVIFKSMKLITVMIGSVVMLKKSYDFLEYLAAGLLVSAAILFSLGDVDVAPKYSSIGLIIVLVSLVADAIHSNAQESLLQDHKATLLETMLFTNFFSAMAALAVLAGNGEFVAAFEYCQERPVAYVLFIARAVVIYGGVLCFVTLIKKFGVVLATSITTVRKILSILASFLLFPKPFTIKYIWGLMIFCVGVAVNVYTSRRSTPVKPK